MKKVFWFLFVFFAVIISFFPLVYFVFDMSKGLLGTKSDELLNQIFWKVPFYVHMVFGGIALLIGWPQFSNKWRVKYLNVHRNMGKIYMVSVLISGSMGLIIAANATGGTLSEIGFSALAVLWLFTTLKGYFSILKSKVTIHENWMIRSYALCFAAVTLRIWIPVFLFLFKMNFIEAYVIISWLCWVPNLLVAELIIYLKVKKSLKIA